MKNFVPALILAALLALAVAMPADPQTLPQPFFSQATATSTTASVPMDLSATKAITVSFWMSWAAYQNDDALAIEYGAAPFGFASVVGGWMVDPDSSQPSTLGAGIFEVGMLGDAGYNQVQFSRPAAGTHYYAFVFDVTKTADTQVMPYVDGVAVPYVKQTNSANTAAFQPATLYFMSRVGNQLVAAGTLSNLAIYQSAFTPQQVQSIYVAGQQAAPPIISPSPGNSVVLPVGQQGDVLAATWETATSQPGTAANGPGWYFQAFKPAQPVALPISCASGLMCSGDATHTSPLSIQTDPAVVQWRVAAPLTSLDTCVQGSYAVDANFRYECVAVNTWMRIPMSHW